MHQTLRTKHHVNTEPQGPRHPKTDHHQPHSGKNQENQVPLNRKQFLWIRSGKRITYFSVNRIYYSYFQVSYLLAYRDDSRLAWRIMESTSEGLLPTKTPPMFSVATDFLEPSFRQKQSRKYGRLSPHLSSETITLRSSQSPCHAKYNLKEGIFGY